MIRSTSAKPRLAPALTLVAACFALLFLAVPQASAAPRVKVAVKAFTQDARGPIALQGRPFRVTGRLAVPARRGKPVLRIFRGGRQVSERRLRVGPGGRVSTRVQLRGRGKVLARLGVRRRGAKPLRADERLLIAAPDLTPGAQGRLVRWVQRRLKTLRFLREEVTDTYDQRTATAVLAYRSANGLRGVPLLVRTDAKLLRKLRAGATGLKARFPNHGRHLEADLSKRVLVFYDGARIRQVLHTSPGKPSTPTILGSYRFYRKDPGRNSSGMLDSNYFIRGYAVHGYDFVPQYGDSHGCLRIPVRDAAWAFRVIRIGQRIDIYR